MYFTQTDIEKRITRQELVLITTDDSSAASPDEDVIAEAVEDAEGEIDSYVGKRYTVPMTDIPKVIVKHGVSIALYYLYRNKSTPRDDENIKENYDNAIGFLKDVSTGKAILQGQSSQAELGKSGNFTTGYFKSNSRTFNRDNLSGF